MCFPLSLKTGCCRLRHIRAHPLSELCRPNAGRPFCQDQLRQPAYSRSQPAGRKRPVHPSWVSKRAWVDLGLSLLQRCRMIYQSLLSQAQSPLNWLSRPQNQLYKSKTSESVRSGHLFLPSQWSSHKNLLFNHHTPHTSNKMWSNPWYRRQSHTTHHLTKESHPDQF